MEGVLGQCLAQLLKEEQLQAVLGLLEQKDVVAGHSISFLSSVVRGS